MSPDRVERFGIALAVVGALALAAGVYLLAGLAWAVVYLGAAAVLAGALAVRVAAVMPEPNRPEGGELP